MWLFRKKSGIWNWKSPISSPPITQKRLHTVELNMTETVKKNHRKYRWCFWHLWPLLNLPQGVNSISLFATRWHSHLFFSNLEFWTEIFCGRSIYGKKLFLQVWAAIFCPKKCLEGPKTQIQKLYCYLGKDWKWPSKSIESTINCLHNVWMPQCSLSLSNFSV